MIVYIHILGIYLNIQNASGVFGNHHSVLISFFKSKLTGCAFNISWIDKKYLVSAACKGAERLCYISGNSYVEIAVIYRNTACIKLFSEYNVNAGKQFAVTRSYKFNLVVAYKFERNSRVWKRQLLNYIGYIVALRNILSHKLLPCRSVKEQIFDDKSCSVGTSDFTAINFLTCFYLIMISHCSVCLFGKNLYPCNCAYGS